MARNDFLWDDWLLSIAVARSCVHDPCSCGWRERMLFSAIVLSLSSFYAVTARRSSLSLPESCHSSGGERIVFDSRLSNHLTPGSECRVCALSLFQMRPPLLYHFSREMHAFILDSKWVSESEVKKRSLLTFEHIFTRLHSTPSFPIVHLFVRCIRENEATFRNERSFFARGTMLRLFHRGNMLTLLNRLKRRREGFAKGSSGGREEKRQREEGLERLCERKERLKGREKEIA